LFRKHGIAYVPSETPKSELYLETLPALNAHRIELLDLPRLVTQFLGLERRTSRAGRDSVDHAPRSHDDLVNSVAGVCVAVGDGPSDALPVVVKCAPLTWTPWAEDSGAGPPAFAWSGPAPEPTAPEPHREPVPQEAPRTTPVAGSVEAARQAALWSLGRKDA